MTHGAWTNADTWQAVTALLQDRNQVVAWDRRGHSRSQDGVHEGSWKEDASDLAGLIEHLGDDPVHVVGNSSGGAVVLNLLAARPELVKTACVHEPGVFALLEGRSDEVLLAAERAGGKRVQELIEAGKYRVAAGYFIDEMGVGWGAWAQIPPQFQATLAANAPTFLDELRQPFQMESVDGEALAAPPTPLLVTSGSESSAILRRSAEELARRFPVRWEVLRGAGHIPHRTHAQVYATIPADFFARASDP